MKEKRFSFFADPQERNAESRPTFGTLPFARHTSKRFAKVKEPNLATAMNNINQVNINPLNLMFMKNFLLFVSALFLVFAAKSQCIYKLPFTNGTSYTCSQGNGGTYSHTGTAQYAFDFSMPINTNVCAARAGTVSHVVESYADYNNPSNCNYVNRVVVDHGDGTSALYLHLTQNGALVNVGDYVTQGQIIAKSGQTGCCTGAHLHFMVMDAGTYGSWYNQSIPISFCDVTSNGGVPVTGSSYTASSCTFGPPVTSTPSNGQTGVSIPVSFNWNDISGASPQYRIQVSTTNSGWTAANGFTTSTSESSTIRVNQNTGSTSSYSWTSSSAYPPQSNTTYYWTVKSYVCGASSNYSAVKSFTTSGGSSNYTISTSSSPSAGGSTSGGGTYASGSSCTVTASANSGYTFTNWTESGTQVSTNASYTFTVSGNRTLVANFTASGGSCVTCPSYDISITPNTSWQTNSSSFGANGCKMYRIPVPSTPGYTYTFKTGCSDGATADFDTYLELFDNSCNLLTSDDDGCESNRSTVTWTSTYTSAAYIYLKVKGYSGASGNFTLAYRRVDPTTNYTISTSSSPSAGGSTSGGGTYSSGQSCTVTASANSGYTFTNWTESGTQVSTNASYTFTVSGNRTLVANFTQNPINYTISTSSSPSAGGTTSGGGTYTSGSSCTVTASANSGYTFTNWTESGTQVSTNASYTFTVSGNRTLVANFTQGGQTVDLNNGLVAYYPFNGNANDASGNGNHGTVNGATLTTDRFCNANSAYNFAGISNPQTISVANSSTLQFTNAATFSFWIYMNSYQGMNGYGQNVATGYHILFAKDYDQCCITGGIGGLSNGEFTANCGTGSGGIGVGDTVSGSQINQWYNITYVITTSNVSIYANGILIASQNGTMSFANSNTKNLWFGRLSATWYPFNGKMDDIRIYNRALNTAEINAIYNLGSGIPTNGLIAHYPFNGNANDVSGNSLNGTVNGNVTLTTDRNNTANSAYYFGGTINDWIEVPHNTLLNIGPDFTVSAWVYKESGSNNYVLGKGRDITCGTWALGTPSISVDGSCGTSASNPTSLNNNQWYMITGVLNSSTGKLRYYQDGQLITEVNSNSFTGNNTYPFAIGRHLTINPPSYSEPWPYPFKGKIDDIVIYNRPLSDAEILQIYQASNSVSGLPAQPSTITGTTAVCQGTSQTYSVTNVSGVTYNWTFPTGWTQTAGGTTNSVTVTVGSGSGNITVMPSNSCGNGTARTLAVTTSTAPAQPSTITGTTAVCQGTSQTYSVTNVSGVTYNWTFPTGWTQTAGGTTNSVTVTVGSGSGNITVTPSNSCGNGTARTLAVTSNPIPPTPTITQNGNILTSDATVGNQWYNQLGVINGATNQNYTVTINGDYYVIVTLNNCSSDSSNILTVTVTGIEVVDAGRIIKVFPNPVSNELIIEIEGNNETVNFDILNAIGQVVFKGNLINKTTVQTSNFAPGVYLIKLENGKTFEFKKIIKE